MTPNKFVIVGFSGREQVVQQLRTPELCITFTNMGNSTLLASDLVDVSRPEVHERRGAYNNPERRLPLAAETPTTWDDLQRPKPPAFPTSTELSSACVPPAAPPPAPEAAACRVTSWLWRRHPVPDASGGRQSVQGQPRGPPCDPAGGGMRPTQLCPHGEVGDALAMCG